MGRGSHKALRIEARGKIVEFAWWLQKQGYKSVKNRVNIIKQLHKLGANIFNPESIKEIIAKQGWDEGTKHLACIVYECFLNGGKKTGSFLQGLKDTGTDPGELLAIAWTDINFQAKTLTIKHLVKDHNPRIVPISDTFIARIQKQVAKCF